MCVPSIAKNKDMIAKTCEMLAFISLSTTQPAYNEKLLSGILARDEDSAKMLKIISDGLVCDYGMNYLGFNDISFTLSRLVGRDKGTDYASWYAKSIDKVEKTLSDLNDAFKGK